MPTVGGHSALGNLADCAVGPECVSLMAGIKKLLGDNGYDGDPFRKSPARLIRGRANRKKRIRHDKKA
jgi:transposase